MTTAPVQLEQDQAVESCQVVQALDVCKRYDRRCVLDQVNLEVQQGGFVALLGANGAGKSTLLRILATLIPASSGRVSLFGQTATAASRDLRARIGMIGHQPVLYRDLTVKENLVFFGKLYSVASPADRSLELLTQLGLESRAHDPVATLSRGMTQRVAIARSLMHDPPLLLADEPFAGLDAPSTAQLEQLLQDLNRQGKSIILSNHDIGQSLRLAHHAIVLKAGRVVIDRPTSRLDTDRVMKEITGS